MRSFQLAGIGLGLAPLLAGCVIVAGNQGLDGDIRDQEFDKLIGAEVSVARSEVAIIAPSNGCTEASQFKPVVREADGDNAFKVGFYRSLEDRCRALVPDGTRLTWTFQQLGIPEGARVTILNRIGR